VTDPQVTSPSSLGIHSIGLLGAGSGSRVTGSPVPVPYSHGLPTTSSQVFGLPATSMIFLEF